jgi:hypothetical protein
MGLLLCQVLYSETCVVIIILDSRLCVTTNKRNYTYSGLTNWSGVWGRGWGGGGRGKVWQGVGERWRGRGWRRVDLQKAFAAD